jgi:hypothetical protein
MGDFFIFYLHLVSFAFIGKAPGAGFLTGSNGMAGWMGMGRRGPQRTQHGQPQPKRVEPRISRISRMGNCKGARSFIRGIRGIHGKILAELGDFAGRQRKKRKEELHKLLSMRPLCSFVAIFFIFCTFSDLH